MDLTPQDIQEKRFREAFIRGYNQQDVDVFLDSVADSYERVYREAQELRQRMRKLEERLNEAEGTEAMLKRTLLAAQKTADDAVRDAKSQSQELLGEADTKAHEIIEAAEKDAERILSDADRLMNDAEAKLDQLRGFVGRYQRDFRAFVENQLNSLEEMPQPPGSPKPQQPTPVKPVTQQPTPVKPVARPAEEPGLRPPAQPATETTPTRPSPPASADVSASPPKAEVSESGEASGGDPAPSQERSKVVTARPEPPKSPAVASSPEPKRAETTESSTEDRDTAPTKPKPHGDPRVQEDEVVGDADKEITELFWGEE
jgi:cell division initiation protein